MILVAIRKEIMSIGKKTAVEKIVVVTVVRHIVKNT